MTDEDLKQAKDASIGTGFRIGTIESVDGGLYLTFASEPDARSKSFKKLNTYTPADGDRVLVARTGKTTYVVLGAIE